MKVWILQNKMRTEKQMRAAALRHRFFFFFFFFFSLNAPAQYLNRRKYVGSASHISIIEF